MYGYTFPFIECSKRSDMRKIVRLDALSIGYQTSLTDKKVIASNISVDLYAGELVCLIGPNGAGKSTLMRTLSGMQAPLAGKVYLGGDDLHRIPARNLARRLSVVLTERVDAGLLTSYEVVALGRYPYTNWSGTLSRNDHRIIHWAIEMTGATELAHRVMNELSDGERQRVMMARALAQEPELMILDEVTAFLDLPRRVDIMRLLQKLAHETGRAILLSTHDLDLALRSADQIWLLPKGGELTVGAPEDLVLNGAFERTFASEGVYFDRQTGSFHIHSAVPHKRVHLRGAGEARTWTQRALERQGFIVSLDEQPADHTVEVFLTSNSCQWKLLQHGQVRTFSSIREMVREIARAV
jgi:iron complex transport system ATP-binding protein